VKIDTEALPDPVARRNRSRCATLFHSMSEPPVKILDKALRVLMLFSPEQPEWGVSTLSREVGMSKSTVHRILRVLEQHGFVAQNAETKRFRLGLAGIELGRRAQAGMELRRIALPIMEQLSSMSGETVLLQVVSPEGDRVVCIERVQQRRGLRLILDVGSTAPLYAGCSSKVLLAYLDKETIDAVLKKRLRPLASHTTTDPAQIRAQLAEIRRKGYAVSFEETDEGVAGVSVPIRDARDRVIASLTISGPLTRVNTATINHYAAIVHDGAERIEAELGRRPSRTSPRESDQPLDAAR
jgi:IclR family transcriptional regulator, KDG regulon repressor